MYDFGNANEAQQRAIEKTEGPLLIIAGPGTGKTTTLVQRAIYLIEEKQVPPEQIMIATFTEKAAKELLTRISGELTERDIAVNLNEMYIGTFHHICLRILQEHMEYTRLKKNYRVMEQFEQRYFLLNNKKQFISPEANHLVTQFLSKSNLNKKGLPKEWPFVKQVAWVIDTLREEMVDLEKMKKNPDSDVAAAARMTETYDKLLKSRNVLDFSAIQIECYHLLRENPQVLQDLQEKIRYIMVDEYQDTNYIQEQLVMLLGEKRHNIGEKRPNICVVGDDDQGLYRFRGATIRNILEFPQKFADGECQIVTLEENYRSNPEIVNFYNNWMRRPDHEDMGFSWVQGNRHYRYEKNIVPFKKTRLQGPCVVKLVEDTLWTKDLDGERMVNPEMGERTLAFIRRAMDSGKVTNYNQIAFLQHSVKSDASVALASYLEAHGVPVYAPRAKMFFEREEIKMALGMFLRFFPDLPESVVVEERSDMRATYKYMTESDRRYFRECLKLTRPIVVANPELRQFIQVRRDELRKLYEEENSSVDFCYSSLFYEMFRFEPFRSMLDVNMADGIQNQRAARNLAVLTKYLVHFEEQHNISVLVSKYVKSNTSKLFTMYLRYLREEGIDEYEDEAEYAPSGCVSFLTNHQAKGMEFPIVIVDAFNRDPWQSDGAVAQMDFLEKVEKKYYHRKPFEQRADKVYFDFWREYYTAFSRAQDLLVLMGTEESFTPKEPTQQEYEELPDAASIDFTDPELVIEPVKDNTIKNVFSFTSHIAVYDACPRQYKFFKELGFAPVRNGNFLFGTLVHETIEDIHKAVLRGEADKVKMMTNIQNWLDSNYNSLVLAHKGYLDEKRRHAAFGQVLDYVKRQRGNWEMVQQAEYEVSMVRPNYIMDGQIDLIRGKDGRVDIVDFKSEKKPTDEVLAARMEHYRQQLQLYAYLVEQRTGQQVGQMQLYYTAEESDDKVVAFPYIKEEVASTVKAFDETVGKILAKDFDGCARDPKTCQNCDFRHYCKRK